MLALVLPAFESRGSESPELGRFARRRQRRRRRQQFGTGVLEEAGTEMDEDIAGQVVLFAAAAGKARRGELDRALRLGADPSRVALGPCVCGLPEAECVCLGYSPLHCACQVGAAGVAYALLVAAANPSVRSGRVLFSLSAKEDSQEADSDGGLIVVDGLTPLHVAAACGHQRIVELLLRHHADPHMGAAEPRKTALGFAVCAGQDEVAELLRRRAAARVLELARAEQRGPESFLARQRPATACLAGGGTPAVLMSNSRIAALRRRLQAREAAAGTAAATAGSEGAAAGKA